MPLQTSQGTHLERCIEVPHGQKDLVDLQKFQETKDYLRPKKTPIKAYDGNTQLLKNPTNFNQLFTISSHLRTRGQEMDLSNRRLKPI